MAAKKPATPAKKPTAAQNTSAPATPGKLADVSATEASQGASQAATPQASAKLVSDDQEQLPPVGESANIEQTQDDLVAHSVMVVARRDGFRRAGRSWSKAPTTVPIDELSEEQIAQLLAEPALKVAFVADPAVKVIG